LLLERYSNIEYVNNLHWKDGIELISKAFEKRAEQRDWELWASFYPFNDGKVYKTFKEFRGNKQNGKNVKRNMSNEEILAKAEEVRAIHRGEHKGIVKE
jgi:hypothetical protein